MLKSVDIEKVGNVQAYCNKVD